MRNLICCLAVAALVGCTAEPPVSEQAETPEVVLARGVDQYPAMQRFLAPYRAKLIKEGYHPDRLARFLAHAPKAEWEFLRQVYTGEIRGVSLMPMPGTPLYEIASTIRLTDAEGDPAIQVRRMVSRRR